MGNETIASLTAANKKLKAENEKLTEENAVLKKAADVTAIAKAQAEETLEAQANRAAEVGSAQVKRKALLEEREENRDGTESYKLTPKQKKKEGEINAKLRGLNDIISGKGILS